MDIIWKKENFMEARRPPHTTTSSKAIYLSPFQLCNNRGCSISTRQKNLCETHNSFHFHRLHCALNLDEFGSSMTRSFKRNMWRAGSGDGHHMEWRESHGGSAAATQRKAAMPFISVHVSLQQQCGCTIDLDRGGVGCWISTLQWTSVTPAFNLALHLGTIGACTRCFSLPTKPHALLGFCRAKSICFDIGLGLHSLSFGATKTHLCIWRVSSV